MNSYYFYCNNNKAESNIFFSILISKFENVVYIFQAMLFSATLLHCKQIH